MIIDSHVHLKHGDVQRMEYSAKTIVRTMDEVGIDSPSCSPCQPQHVIPLRWLKMPLSSFQVD